MRNYLYTGPLTSIHAAMLNISNANYSKNNLLGLNFQKSQQVYQRTYFSTHQQIFRYYSPKLHVLIYIQIIST